jgi:hypothetical protein
VGKEESQAIGLGLLSQKALGLLTTSQELEKVLRKLEPSEKIVASVEVFRCHELKDITSAPITISFVLGVDKDLIVLPLSAPAIPVRVKPR